MTIAATHAHRTMSAGDRRRPVLSNRRGYWPSLAALAACAMLSPLPAQARESGAIGDSGNAFVARCAKSKPEPCRAYISGVVDGLIVAGMATKANLICLPSGVTTSQIHDLVVGHMRDNPSLRHLRTDALTYKALSQAFPCQPAPAPKRTPRKRR